MLRPDVAAEIARFNRYGSPNAAAMRQLPDAPPYPTAAELTDLEYQLDLGGASERWDRIWTEIKAG